MRLVVILGVPFWTSIQFTALEAIESVTFERTQIRFEKPEATLKITTDNGIWSDIAHIFDHYN